MMINPSSSQREEGLWYTQCTYHGKTTVISTDGRRTSYENTILTLSKNRGLITQNIPHLILDVRNKGTGPDQRLITGLFTVWVPPTLTNDQVKQDGNTITFYQLYRLPPQPTGPVTFTFHFVSDKSIVCDPPVIGSSSEEKTEAVLAILKEVMK